MAKSTGKKKTATTKTAATKTGTKAPAKKSPARKATQKSAATVPATTITTTLVGDAADMVRDIVSIAERLEANNLQALFDAAHALETKGKIEKFNRELNVAADKAARRRREISAPEYRVTIERTKDDFFIIQLDAVRVFFNKQEMREITRHCHAAENARAAARRLFRWFERERSDLLTDAGINSERNPYLLDLYEQVISTYKVKE
jgi:hypothetical protein